MTEQHKNTSLQSSFTEARDAAAALEERVSHLVDLSVQRLEGLGKIGQEFVTALNESGVHIVCRLFDRLPELLVEQRSFSWSCSAAGSISMAG